MSLNQIIDDGNNRPWLDVRFDNVTSSGNIVANGGVTGTLRGDKIELHGTNGPETRISTTLHGAGTSPASAEFGRSRGTHETPTAILANDVIGNITGSGYDGSEYVVAGKISIVANETFSALGDPAVKHRGTRLELRTVPDGAAQLETLALTLTHDGRGLFDKGLGMTEDGIRFGKVTLVAGNILVPTVAVKNVNQQIMISREVNGGTSGFLGVTALNGDQDFTITSTSNLDTSTVIWWLIDTV